MSTALYTLRAVQIGLKLSDLDSLSMGELFDLITEAGNDNYEYPELATQDDFDRF